MSELSRHVPIEELEVFRNFVSLSNEIWEMVVRWDNFSKETVGKQLTRALDSVGANLVEGDGRQGDADAIRFFVIARASARESRYWILRARERHLFVEAEGLRIEQDLLTAARQLNGLIRYRRERKKGTVQERRFDYMVESDPFAEPDFPTPDTQHPDSQTSGEETR